MSRRRHHWVSSCLFGQRERKQAGGCSRVCTARTWLLVFLAAQHSEGRAWNGKNLRSASVHAYPARSLRNLALYCNTHLRAGLCSCVVCLLWMLAQKIGTMGLLLDLICVSVLFQLAPCLLLEQHYVTIFAMRRWKNRGFLVAHCLALDRAAPLSSGACSSTRRCLWSGLFCHIIMFHRFPPHVCLAGLSQLLFMDLDLFW